MMNYLVVDSGFVIQAILASADQEKYVETIGLWKKNGVQLVAPTLWQYEIASTLTKLSHFKYISWDAGLIALNQAIGLEVELVDPDFEQVMKAHTWTRRLKRAAAYDSFYLALAETLGCDFYTVDKKLKNAVAENWVKFI